MRELHGPAAWALVLLAAGCTVAKEPAPAADASGQASLSRDDPAAIIANLRWIDTTEGIDDLRPIEVGGITQWISIRGKHKSNPILLFVHGGPGSPMMPAAWAFQTPWEEYFTVVQWDQRGAGKTAAANDPATVIPTISLERMVADGEEVVQYLRATFGKRKIFLMATRGGPSSASRSPSVTPSGFTPTSEWDRPSTRRPTSGRATSSRSGRRGAETIAPRSPSSKGSLPTPRRTGRSPWSRS